MYKRQVIARVVVGIVVVGIVAPSRSRAGAAPTPPRAPQITHDTTKFTFDLPSPSMSLGLPLGKHVKIFAPNMTGVEAGKWSARPRPHSF